MIALGISALPAQDGHVSGAERAAFRWINDLPELLRIPLESIMQLGNITAVAVVATTALLFRRFRMALGFTIAGVGAYLAARLVKDASHRGRPADLLDAVRLRGTEGHGFGYVSGHAAVAFAVVTVATMWLGRRAAAVAWCLAVVVAVARVYVGAHLPLDVVGGAAVGIALGCSHTSPDRRTPTRPPAARAATDVTQTHSTLV